ncbi:MAG: hypothetical protein ACYCPV_04670 [Thermoplasmata archaeon]|jgi:hypothetical protein
MTAPPPRLIAARPLTAAWTAAVGMGLLAIAIPYLASASVTLGVLTGVVGLTQGLHRDRPRIGPLCVVVGAVAAGAAFLAGAPPELAPVRALGFALALTPLAGVGGAIPWGSWGVPRRTP